LGYNNQNHFS